MSSFKSWFEKSRLPREDEEETERASIPSRDTEDESASTFTTFFGGAPQTDEEKDLESAGLLSSWSERWNRATQAAETEWTCGLSRTQRFQAFVMLLLASLVLFSLAFFFLPMVLIFPSKFVTSFTFGSLSFMSAIGIWNGPKATLRSLFNPERLPFTSVYLLSIFASLYAALVMGNYIVVLAASIAQVVALLWYGLSFVPGGTRGLSFLSSMMCRSVSGLCVNCFSSGSG